MIRILPLVKKDGKHLGPYMALLWVVMAFACYSDYNRDYAIPFPARTALQILAGVAPLLCAAFVVIAIQQESLIGNRQYWVTRPFTWRDLLVSKLLFILLTVNLPLFVFQASSMALHGLPPYPHVAELLWRQVFFTAFMVVTPAALAVITRAPGHALASVIVAAIAFYIGMMFLERLGPFGPSWGSWIAAAAMATLSGCLGSAAIWLQYRRRRPEIPRVLFACLVLLYAPAATLPWAAAWEIQPWLSTRHIGPGDFPITFDPRKGAPLYYQHRDPSFVHLEIPIRIGALAKGDRLVINRLQFSPDLRLSTFDPWAGRGWIFDNMIHDVVDGAGWLRLFAETNSYARLSDRTIDLHGAADLALFVYTQTVESRRADTELAAVGVCHPYPEGCITALPRASVENWLGESLPTYVVSPTQTYAPFPARYLLNPVREFAAGRGTLVVRKPVAWFTRTFEFRNIRLSDYVR